MLTLAHFKRYQHAQMIYLVEVPHTLNAHTHIIRTEHTSYFTQRHESNFCDLSINILEMQGHSHGFPK